MTTRIKGARMHPTQRKEQILQTAIKLSIERGYKQLTRKAIAKHLNCVSGLITHYYPHISDLRQEVLNVAIQQEIIPILAQNLVIWGEETSNLPQDLKQKVANYLTN